MSDEFDHDHYNNSNNISNNNHNINNGGFAHSKMFLMDKSKEGKIYDTLVSTSDSSNSIYTQFMNISSVTDRSHYIRPMMKFFAANLTSKLIHFYNKISNESANIMYKVAQMRDDYDTYTEQRDGLISKLADIKIQIVELNFLIRENELASNIGGGGGGSRYIDLQNDEISQLKKKLSDKTQELKVYQNKYDAMVELIFDYDDQNMNIVDEMIDNRKLLLKLIRICNRYLDKSIPDQSQFLPGIEMEFSIEVPAHFELKELVFLNMCLEETENVASAHLKWHPDIYSLLNDVSTKNIITRLGVARHHMSESTFFLVTCILLYIRLHFLHLN